jgi:hypothetical protein
MNLIIVLIVVVLDVFLLYGDAVVRFAFLFH